MDPREPESGRARPEAFDSASGELAAGETPLAPWRANVGEPVRLDLARLPDAAPSGLDVLCWNVAIGRGRLAELLERLRAGEHGEPVTGAPERPLIVLAQEAYRADPSVPAEVSGRAHGGLAPRAGSRREDIVALAGELGLSLSYFPSMRNGRHPSDRGNAILSTAALAATRPIELPHVRQRRVAVTARLEGLSGVRLVSAHLDTGGQAGGRRIGRLGAGRAHQAAALAAALEADDEVLIGADLNAHLGARDPALRELQGLGFASARRRGRWRSTTAGALPFLLDHVLFRSRDGRIAEVTVERLHSAGGRLGRRAFGSDHHPLLARVRLASP